MSNAEHLLENVIYAMAHGESPKHELDKAYNRMMRVECGISEDDLIRMACHVVYSLYDGKFPDFPPT